jgi:hypothetical protein
METSKTRIDYGEVQRCLNAAKENMIRDIYSGKLTQEQIAKAKQTFGYISNIQEEVEVCRKAHSRWNRLKEAIGRRLHFRGV